MIKANLFDYPLLILTIVCFVLPNTGKAQPNLASLKQTLTQESVDSNKAKICLEIATEYFRISSDTGLYYTQQALDLSLESANENFKEFTFSKVKELAYETAEIAAYKIVLACFEQLVDYSNKVKSDSLLGVSSYGKAAILITLGEPLKALETIEKVLELAEKGFFDEKDALSIYNLLAEIHLILGNVDLAIQYNMDALRLAEKNEVVNTAVSCYNRLSFIHREQGNLEKSLKYSLKALGIIKEIGHPVRLGNQYHDLAAIYFMKVKNGDREEVKEEDLKLLEAYTQMALNKSLMTSNKALQGVCYAAMGHYYLFQEIYDTAGVYYLQALETFKLVGDKFNENTVYVNLAVSYSKQAKVEKNAKQQQEYLVKARDYGEKAFRNYELLGIFSEQVKIAYILSGIYVDLADYAEAYEYLSIYGNLKDSLFDEEKLKIVEDLELKYQTEKKEFEIKSLNQEKALQLAANRQQKIVLYAVVGVLSVVLLLMGLLYWFFAQKRRANLELISKNNLITEQKKLVDQQNEEKELLLKEIHHRVKNNLQIISSLLDLQSNKIEDASARIAIADGQARVKSMALIHHKLYQHDKIASINFKEYVEQLYHQIMASLNSINATLILEVDTKLSFDIDTAIPLGLILNELLTNACKYAFVDNPNPELKIKLQELEQGNYLLEVQDNGKGMPDDFQFQKARSLGLRLVRRLSKQLFGRADYENHNGAHFNIHFKDTALRKTID